MFIFAYSLQIYKRVVISYKDIRDLHNKHVVLLSHFLRHLLYIFKEKSNPIPSLIVENLNSGFINLVGNELQILE